MSSTFIDNISAHTLTDPNNNTILEEEEDEDRLNVDMRNCSMSSSGSSIDIQGRSVSSDILVALLDRPNEMRQLATRNSQFYEAIENYITETQGNFAWQRFQDIVYKPREKLPDRVWITQIGHFLAHNPVFFSKFKESVGYEDENEDVHTSISAPPPALHKLTSSTSTGSSTGGSGRRRSRRLSSVSFGNNDALLDLNDEDLVLEEEAPNVPDGMFASEDQFYHQQFSGGRRRRPSYHSIQSEPHPTFVDSKIDEVDEAEVEHGEVSGGEESDHLAELLNTSSSDDDDEEDKRRINEIGVDYLTPRTSRRRSNYNDMDLIKLRDYPDFQANLPQSHAQFFRKAKQLLSLAPSSRRFSATIRRNSILEDAMPPSPVTELDEPRIQTCSEEDENEGDGNLAYLICCTRRQQPDDVAWLNGVMEALAGWPELVDRLHDIINESLED